MRCQRLSVQGCRARRYGDAHASGAADHWCAPELRVLACARQFNSALCRAFAHWVHWVKSLNYLRHTS